MAFNLQCALIFKYFLWSPFILSCSFAFALENHKCWIPLNNRISVASNEYTISAVKSVSENLRITMNYTERIRKLSNFALLKKELLEPAAAFWSKTLRAKNSPSGPILFNRNCVNDAVSIYSDGQKYCAKGCSDQTFCYMEPISDDYLGQCMEIKNGVRIRTGTAGRGLSNTDFMLIVDADADDQCRDGFLGFAAICQVDNSLNRQVAKVYCLGFIPILGYVNLCSRAIVSDSGLNELAYSTFVHEIAHSLGFSPTMYALLRDENGEPRTKRNPTTQLPALGYDSNGLFIPDKTTLDTVDRTWKSAKGTFMRRIKVLKTPMLLMTAREHFNCPTLDGVDLENQGGDATAGAHFEKRLVMNELMSGSILRRSVVSKLTLAFFYDSGWYDVDMSQAEPLTWGRNLGCDFVLKSCYEYMEIQKLRKTTISPWCNKITLSTQCLSDENSFGFCDLKNLGRSLGPQNQYFNELENVPDDQISKYGGVNELADYCPKQISVRETAYTPSTTCSHATNQAFFGEAVNGELQYYGPDSVCVDHNSSKAWSSAHCSEVSTFLAIRATCHRRICSSTEGLVLIFADNYFQCPLYGGSIRIDTVNNYYYLTGNATCPACSNVCQNCPSVQQLRQNLPSDEPKTIPCGSSRMSIHMNCDVLLLISVFLFLTQVNK
ncbi:hypothetical protein EG68_04664 [Paragonimus skrjabini miyazakii]|uniref:Leishmanolysin-like peptidase n=1 Tax=Paragonimus skrjabini miyazakii TaxID=59628 RepID=A0A8S9YYS2_9TREM|nr:hypothetical protein EG68_04664 [Paragonimus skrjabini miyazakii]